MIKLLLLLVMLAMPCRAQLQLGVMEDSTQIATLEELSLAQRTLMQYHGRYLRIAFAELLNELAHKGAMLYDSMHEPFTPKDYLASDEEGNVLPVQIDSIAFYCKIQGRALVPQYIEGYSRDGSTLYFTAALRLDQLDSAKVLVFGLSPTQLVQGGLLAGVLHPVDYSVYDNMRLGYAQYRQALAGKKTDHKTQSKLEANSTGIARLIATTPDTLPTLVQAPDIPIEVLLYNSQTNNSRQTGTKMPEDELKSRLLLNDSLCHHLLLPYLQYMQRMDVRPVYADSTHISVDPVAARRYLLASLGTWQPKGPQLLQQPTEAVEQDELRRLLMDDPMVTEAADSLYSARLADFRLHLVALKGMLAGGRFVPLYWPVTEEAEDLPSLYIHYLALNLSTATSLRYHGRTLDEWVYSDEPMVLLARIGPHYLQEMDQGHRAWQLLRTGQWRRLLHTPQFWTVQ